MAELVKINEIGVDTLLGSLALLRLNVLSKDYISSFVSFIATLIAKNKYDDITVDNICEDFGLEYGFNIPRMPMIAILDKCVKEKLIHRGKDGKYYPDLDKGIELSFSTDSKRKADLYHKVVEDFCNFVKKEYNVELSSKDSEEIIFSFINENSSKTIALHSVEMVRPQNINDKNFLMIAQYIKYVAENKNDIFTIVQDIATAHIISSALISELEYENANTREGNYHSLILYLDTPVVLKILGLNTEEMKESYELLLKQLKSRNNKLKIFQHTFDEIHDILEDCEKWIENPFYNAKYASPALKTFVKRKFTASEVGLFIEKLPQMLADVGIDIDTTDYYNSRYNYLQIDDKPIRREIIKFYKENITGFNYKQKEMTIERDVKSITSIYKLRRNKKCSTYKEAKYLFITTNTSLAYISRYSTKIDNPSYSYHVYPCITDIVLGTDIWISSPVDKVSTFSRKKLLADCSVAVLPSEKIIEKLSDSIETLYNANRISENDYYLLKLHAFNDKYLINKTMNDENSFSDSITEEILANIYAEIEAPLQNKIEKLKREKDEYQLREEESIEKSRQNEALAQQYAIKKLQNLEQIVLTVAISFFALLVIVLTGGYISFINKFMVNHYLVVKILRILSPIATVVSAMFKVILNRNTFAIKSHLIKTWTIRKKAYLYKKNLKSES